MTESVKPYTEFILPPSVVTRADVSRLANELERVDGDMTSARLRGQVQTTPNLSLALHDFIEANKFSLDDDKARTELIAQIHSLKDNAPVIHMTFAEPADSESLGTLVEWLRTSVDPKAVIAVGLQPALIAGVYVRTPNHVHDFSLKGKLQAGHDVLVSHLKELQHG